MSVQAKNEAAGSDGKTAEGGRAREGKYLTFSLGSEDYGLQIMRVREILVLLPITVVPQTPEFVRGVINLRGKVIPVIDLRLKFGMTRTEYGRETCIIVVEVDGVHMGVIVDRVQEVVDILEGDIEDSPHFGAKVDTEFILGMGKKNGKVKILLDIERVIGSEDLVLAGGEGGK